MWFFLLPVSAFGETGFFMSVFSRFADYLVFLIHEVQFIGAMWVIKPSLIQLLMCLVVVCFGFGIFRYLRFELAFFGQQKILFTTPSIYIIKKIGLKTT